MAISVTTKISLAIGLVLSGFGIEGVLIGFTIFPSISSILLAINFIIVLRSTWKESRGFISRRALHSILAASIPSWIPSLITTIGSQLGTIVVFGIQGSDAAGIYFIAFSIASAISTVVSVLLVIGYPTLSAMLDGRKLLAWRLIKLSILAGLPIASIMICYPKDILMLFGPGYQIGALPLQILLLPLPIVTLTIGVSTLSYAYGNYRQVLIIGLATSLPRTVLYFLLVPYFNMSGASISYSIGSIIGFIASIIIARKIGLKIFWKDILLLCFIPLGITFSLRYLTISFIWTIMIVIPFSYILFIRFLILTRKDIEDVFNTLPQNYAKPITNIISQIAKKINANY